MTAFYNEIAAYPAAWTRNLIAAGHVADGVVDERSIVELDATELVGFEQCHFFAGIGGWSYALRLAGWPDDRPVWTASCPCQPFSTAGKGRGVDDERHLWPVLFELVRECRPSVLFGEQVASPAGRSWFDAVSADLESAGYAVGAANLCAAGVGAPHIRQRLYFVAVADADSGGLGEGKRRFFAREPDDGRSGSAVSMAEADGQRLDGERLRVLGQGPLEADAQAAGRGEAGGRMGECCQRDCGCWDRDCAHRKHGYRPQHFACGQVAGRTCDRRMAYGACIGRREGRVSRDAAPERAGSSDDGRMGDADRDGAGRYTGSGDRAEATGDRARLVDGRDGHDAGASGPWGDAEWIPCTDGKSRPAQPGSFPLAYGVPSRLGSDGTVETRARVGELAGYGNAIVPTVAATWIRAVMEVRP